MKLTEKKVSLTHRVCVYGPPSIGKTKLVGALSEFKKLLWFDLDNGFKTLLQFPVEWQERIEIISLPDTKTFPIAIETCLKVIKGGKGKICEQHGKWNCPACISKGLPSVEVCLAELPDDTVVVFDSLTQLTSSAIAHITKGKDDDYKMQTDDWGSLAKLMEVFLSHVQNAPYNIVCISHELDKEKDEKAPERLVPVAGSRNSSKNTARFFDEVIRGEVSNKKHRFYSSTTSALNFVASSRTGFRIEDLPEPSLVPLFCPDKMPPAAPLKEVVTETAKATSSLTSLLSKKIG